MKPPPAGPPTFLDNRDGNTLAEAVRLRAQGAAGLRIASGFFDLPGFRLLADALESLPQVRLLLGAEPRPEASLPDPEPGQPTGPRATRRAVAEALREMDDGLRRSRDRLPFDADTDRHIHRLLTCLESGLLEVRRCEGDFLPARVFLFDSPAGTALAPLSPRGGAGRKKRAAACWPARATSPRPA